jgi:adenylate cyclase
MAQTRQLAAIMFTDIVGYTSLMGDDEQKAFELLKKNRQVQKPVIETFNGKLIKELGDGILASFTTATDAVNAAVKILNDCNAENNFQLRIGVHLGEVIFENEDVFGDGVNIASRIQAVAIPNHIYISEAVHQNVINKKNITTKFVSEEKFKNVNQPVKIYEVVTDLETKPYSSIHNTEPANTPKKSIAVLPFLNMSNDAEQDYFCDGISEEILNALTHINALRIISRTSSFALKNRNLNAAEIGKTLDVQYFLEGSVRKAGKRLRITTKLVNAADGSHLWSESYNRELEDIFSIQEDIAGNVVTALQGFLTMQEKEVIHRPETIIGAYEYFLKGRQLFHKLFLQEAKNMFEKAIELDADYALAYAGLADTHSWLYEWEGAKNADLDAAEKYSLKALLLAPNLSESHTSRAYVLSLAKKYDEAEKEFEEGIKLNSNSFDVYYLYARTCFARGQIEKSAQLFLKASEVRQEDFQSLLLLAQSLRVLGKKEVKQALEEGIKRARNLLKLNSTDRRVLSLAPGNLWDLGNKKEAFEWMNKALQLYPEDAGVLINAACLYAKDNHKEEALNILEKAVNKGYGKKDWIEHDPDYDSLRNEPRFKALLNKLK